MPKTTVPIVVDKLPAKTVSIKVGSLPKTVPISVDEPPKTFPIFADELPKKTVSIGANELPEVSRLAAEKKKFWKWPVGHGKLQT